ncbi:class I SAM-dependent methyltransferase [Actinoallomurus purpureus]|uniref:class I SAM-dependent methyltransferase n=1 Tax=Actinoallomurus purpureus TaxID=478114 RepID=UPI002091FE7A|nr:class I SAM-dependent methyltransferase [Actinoallomurus purpureus]MCO6008415.1 class I SAM-dependent methyltransferase [Actinoallomurus purpureus]
MIIDACRVCGNRELLPLLDLGPQALTGVFPRTPDESVPEVPLELVKCSPSGCGLVQLRHTADLALMYNEGYGYRSGIRPFMVDHLAAKVDAITRRVAPGPGDLVLDIGSNDGTLLGAYDSGPTRVGVDPVGARFLDRYPADAELIPDFFSEEAFTARFGDRRATAVTSIAMFYDLPEPMTFMRDVRDVLADDGVWMLEQSYLPAALDSTAYDVVCHEHLEYYTLRQIEWMAERAGLTVIEAELGPVYGGSLCVILARTGSRHRPDEASLARIRASESAAGLDTPAPYEAFAKRAYERRDRLRDFLDASKKAGMLSLGYGASTKGNVILQFCGIGADDLPCIGEVNQDKAGCFTPGTMIPIVSESEAKDMNPDQMLVLPWIHRQGFLERERDYLAGGGRMVFPLPEIDVVGDRAQA